MRRQDGFTLPELLIGISMSMIIALAGFALVDTAMKRTGETADRVEATQRGRQAMDVMTRSLRSQVCLPADQLAAPITTAQPAVALASPTQVTYFTDMSTGTAAFPARVEKRELIYDPAKRTITERRYKTTGVAPIVWQSSSAKKTLVTNVVPDPKFSPLPGSPTIFRYYAFGAASGSEPPKTNVELTNPGAADIGRIARIDIAFVTRAGSEKATTTSDASLSLRSQVYVRSADPNDPAPYPTCV
jgi:Tfp pilus assembly protein PilW